MWLMLERLLPGDACPICAMVLQVDGRWSQSVVLHCRCCQYTTLSRPEPDGG